MRALVAVLLLVAVEAAAQTPPPVEPVQPILRNLTRVEIWRYFEPPSSSTADPDTAHVGNRLLAGVRVRHGTLDGTFALQYVQFGGLPADAIGPGALGTGALYYDHAGRSDSAQVYLRAANVAWRGLGGAWDVQVGRMGYTSGAERPSVVAKIEAVKRMRLDSRLIGEFEWSLYQRAYDGVRVDWKPKRWTLTGAALQPTQGGFEDAAGVHMGDVTVLSAAATSAPGVAIPRSELQLFSHYYADDRAVTARPDNTRRSATRADIGITTVGAHVVSHKPVGAGEVDLLGWVALQTGSWYEQQHRAIGLSAEAGYQWTKARWAPWVRGGVLHTSGDGDAADDRHGTFFPMLPTVRRYAQSTLYSLANLRDVFAQVIVRPTARLTGRLDLHRLSLASSADGWYAGSGATQNRGRIFGYTLRSSGGRSRLMDVVEGSLDWRIAPQWSINGYAAMASGGPVVRASFAGKRAAFFYVESVITAF